MHLELKMNRAVMIALISAPELNLDDGFAEDPREAEHFNKFFTSQSIAAHIHSSEDDQIADVTYQWPTEVSDKEFEAFLHFFYAFLRHDGNMNDEAVPFINGILALEKSSFRLLPSRELLPPKPAKPNKRRPNYVPMREWKDLVEVIKVQ